MNIAFIVNRVATESPTYTTTRLAWRAVNAGHQVALVDLGELIYQSSGCVRARATLPRHDRYTTDQAFLADVQADDARRDTVVVDDLDVLMLRSNPADEAQARTWATTSDLLFAQLAAARGVIVVNDPTHLTDATNKTYFQGFPEAVRPRTCISRNAEEVRRFIDHVGGTGVIKPLQGSGGHGVFVVGPEERANLDQMIEAVIRDGYLLAQEFLPSAAETDLRLIMLNGEPLHVDGTWACVRRISGDGEARTNVAAGGKVEAAVPDENALRIAEVVGPKLKRDGMHLAGLDVAGDKLMEINVHTTGGVSRAEDLTGAPFSDHVLRDLERKVRLHHHYGSSIDNATLAVA